MFRKCESLTLINSIECKKNLKKCTWTIEHTKYFLHEIIDKTFRNLYVIHQPNIFIFKQN